MKRRIAVIDAETDPFRKGRIPKPFVWGFYDGSIYKQFATTKELAEFLAQEDCICYAHNGGKFDFHYLIEYLEAWDYIKIINGRIAQAYIGLCELRDSWLIINEPLSKYKKDDIDYALMEEDRRDEPETRRKIEVYLKSDCVYLWELVVAFIDRYGNTLTQAGAAMKQWAKISGSKPPTTNVDYYNDFAPYYYGGRVECFESGVIETDFNVYDINSAYAEAMKHKHPYSANYERVNGYAKGADFYRIRCVSYGALPYRGDGGDSGKFAGLSFPHDNQVREYTITGWELAAAQDTKSIRKISYLESIRFMTHTDFSVYIDHFWNLRKVAQAQEPKDILGDLMAKLMMNSLYGKFAANPANYYNYMIVPRTEASVLGAGVAIREGNGQSWEFGGELGCWLLAQRQLDEFQRRYYNIATGASITGYVRAKLWRAIHSCENSGDRKTLGRVLYVDTDSIACERKGKAVIIGSALGEWKDEGRYNKAGIGGKKLYIFRGAVDNVGKDGNGPRPPGRKYKTASKGAKLTHAQLWKIANGGEVYYERDVPTYSVTKPLDFENPEKSFTNRWIVNTAKRNK